MAIDIGPGATDRVSSSAGGMTILAVGNPANANGKLNSMEVWSSVLLSGTKMGTFYGSGTSRTMRDYESIGAVTGGSKQTFTGLDCDVQTNDILGIYFSLGSIEQDVSGGDGILYKFGDCFAGGANTYSSSAGYAISVYATGTESSTSKPHYYFNMLRRRR